MARRLRRRGLEPGPAEGPVAFLDRAAQACPDLARELAEIRDVYAALRYGPLIYNIESVDQDINQVLSPYTPLTTEWSPSLLGGVVVIKGTFTNGNPFVAIPNYARLNRGGRSIVWIKDQ